MLQAPWMGNKQSRGGWAAYFHNFPYISVMWKNRTVRTCQWQTNQSCSFWGCSSCKLQVTQAMLLSAKDIADIPNTCQVFWAPDWHMIGSPWCSWSYAKYLPGTQAVLEAERRAAEEAAAPWRDLDLFDQTSATRLRFGDEKWQQNPVGWRLWGLYMVIYYQIYCWLSS